MESRLKLELEATLSKTMIKLPGKSILIKIAQPVMLVLVGAATRLVPHPANFVPIGAMALFGGTYLKKKEAFILPLLSLFLSDLFIGFDSLAMRLSVYGSFLITVFIGFWLKSRRSLKNLVLAALSSSIIFFLTTNFTVWFLGNMYAKSPAGLVMCYILALPFFKNTIAGDLFYSGVFFGSYELVKNLTRINKFALENQRLR
jgi:hypothetical protein